MLVAPSLRAASTIKASFLFAAALCEISGSFLIFPSIRSLSEAPPSPASHPDSGPAKQLLAQGTPRAHSAN